MITQEIFSDRSKRAIDPSRSNQDVENPGTRLFIQTGAWGGPLVDMPAYNRRPGVSTFRRSSSIRSSWWGDGLLRARRVWVTPGRDTSTGRLSLGIRLKQNLTARADWHAISRRSSMEGRRQRRQHGHFRATADGELCAYEAHTGKRLWGVSTRAASSSGAPSTVSSKARQLICRSGRRCLGEQQRSDIFKGSNDSADTECAPSRLMVFALSGSQRLPPTTLQGSPPGPSRPKRPLPG